MDIEPIDHVTSAADALLPDAPPVHRHVSDNVVVDARFDTGGVDEAFDAAEAVVEFDLRSRRQNAMPLEARGSVASYDRRTGRVTLAALRTVAARGAHRDSRPHRDAGVGSAGGGSRRGGAPSVRSSVWRSKTRRRYGRLGGCAPRSPGWRTGGRTSCRPSTAGSSLPRQGRLRPGRAASGRGRRPPMQRGGLFLLSRYLRGGAPDGLGGAARPV